MLDGHQGRGPQQTGLLEVENPGEQENRRQPNRLGKPGRAARLLLPGGRAFGEKGHGVDVMTQTGTQGKRSSPKAAVATRYTAKFLVVGTAIAETILHQPGGEERRGLGGVAATIALALAEAGNEVTLITSIGQGPEGTRAKNLLGAAPLRTIIRDSTGAAGYATINTRQGEQQQANGRWPRATGLGPLAEREIHRHEIIIADTNMTPGNLLQLLDHPGKLTMVNGTTTLGTARIPTRWNNRLGMLTVNQAEAQALMQRLNCHGEKEMMRRLRAQSMLLTRDSSGWRFYNQNGDMAESPAAPVPEHTDFIGCGDYAAAGAVHAVVHGLDPEATINGFIQRKLEANVVIP